MKTLQVQFKALYFNLNLYIDYRNKNNFCEFVRV